MSREEARWSSEEEEDSTLESISSSEQNRGEEENGFYTGKQLPTTTRPTKGSTSFRSHPANKDPGLALEPSFGAGDMMRWHQPANEEELRRANQHYDNEGEETGGKMDVEEGEPEQMDGERYEMEDGTTVTFAEGMATPNRPPPATTNGRRDSTLSNSGNYAGETPEAKEFNKKHGNKKKVFKSEREKRIKPPDTIDRIAYNEYHYVQKPGACKVFLWRAILFLATVVLGLGCAIEIPSSYRAYVILGLVIGWVVLFVASLHSGRKITLKVQTERKTVSVQRRYMVLFCCFHKQTINIPFALIERIEIVDGPRKWLRKQDLGGQVAMNEDYRTRKQKCTLYFHVDTSKVRQADAVSNSPVGGGFAVDINDDNKRLKELRKQLDIPGVGCFGSQRSSNGAVIVRTVDFPAIWGESHAEYWANVIGIARDVPLEWDRREDLHCCHCCGFSNVE